MAGRRTRASMSTWLLPLLIAGLVHKGVKLATCTSPSQQPQPECASGAELVLSLTYAANATGHRSMAARLDQPVRSRGWQLRVEVGGLGCGPGGAPWRSLSLALDGPPSAGGLVGPSPSPAPPPVPAPPGYLTLPSMGHYRAPPDALDWYSARQLCRREGGGLLVPTSRRELEELFAHFHFNATGTSAADRMWHGANDIRQEGRFVTDDGQPLDKTGYAEFYPGTPRASTSLNCLTIYNDRSLQDLDCGRKLAFICKVSL